MQFLTAYPFWLTTFSTFAPHLFFPVEIQLKSIEKPTPTPISLSSKRKLRVVVSLFFFCQGLVFSTWASRIPDIKNTLHLSDGNLGSILLALPLGQMTMMLFSGQIVTHFSSKKVLSVAVLFYAFGLTNMALASNAWQVAAALYFFGAVGNLCNISVNTQGLNIEKLYGKSIMSSFHGIWSTAGVTGALIGFVMIHFHIPPYTHFWIMALVAWANVMLNAKKLSSDEPHTGNVKKKIFMKPEKVLVQLGIIGFCCMAAEGAMFDWSGVYFRDVVKAKGALAIAGYASFMTMMATGRLLGDKIISRIGRKQTLQISGMLIFLGLLLAVAFPYLIPSIIGFMMVGLGVSTIVPSVYSLAGTKASVPPSIALAMVSSVSYLGFLIGPPVIGYIAEVAGLRGSYTLIACLGILITLWIPRLKLFH